MTVDAVLSTNRKYAVCGACGRSLCRRDRVDGNDITGHAHVHHELVWDADWHMIEDHIERSEAALDRLHRGNAPVRRGTLRGWAGPKQSLNFPNFPPALCPWAVCGTLNRIDPKRLDVEP